jgi:hypothetical protein
VAGDDSTSGWVCKGTRIVAVGIAGLLRIPGSRFIRDASLKQRLKSWLVLKGLGAGNIFEALRAILGPDAGPPAAFVTRIDRMA